MAVTTRLQTRYAVQKVFVVILCVVMGAWGLYDYYVKIPGKTQAYERGQLCLVVKQALEAEPGTPNTRSQIAAARTAVQGQITELLTTGIDKPTDETMTIDALEAIRDRGDEGWLKMLVLFGAALEEGDRRTPGSTPSTGFALAFEAARTGVNATADVSPPSKFDRLTQWAFILSLPFAPYFAWGLLRERGRVYRREDDGTLDTPKGKITPDQIKSIDMSRWMRKSVATIDTTDGRQIKLDDYVYKNVDKIVGAIASEQHPAEWDENARPRKADAATEPEPAEPAEEPSVH